MTAKPEPRRAGGYIDRGDGKGWVLNDEDPKPVPEPQPHADPKPGPSKVGGWRLLPETEPVAVAYEPEPDPEEEPPPAKPAAKKSAARRK